MKINLRLMAYWKSLLTLKEIKRPSGKFLEFKLRLEICVKIFEFRYENLNEKLIFNRVLSYLPGHLSF